MKKRKKREEQWLRQIRQQANDDAKPKHPAGHYEVIESLEAYILHLYTTAEKFLPSPQSALLCVKAISESIEALRIAVKAYRTDNVSITQQTAWNHIIYLCNHAQRNFLRPSDMLDYAIAIRTATELLHPFFCRSFTE